MDILSVVTRVPILVFGVERHDDDFADRINYKYTVAVLVIFAIIVTNRQFGTKQIHCWIPAYFTRNYEEYINDICWVSNTYYISLDQKLPEADQIRKSFELKYYQWVPFILLSQAFFFYIPHIAWRALSRRSGIDVRDIVEAAGNYKSVDKYEIRKKYMSYMLTAVDQYCDDPRRRKESRGGIILRRLLSAVCCISGKFLGNYLMVLYLFIKLTFIANCISQMFLLNLLLGHEFHKFGFELIDKILNGKGWDTGSRIFPKISMCDFRIREVGNPKVSHRYTVQCVLPINLFNQQIFTFIWFWYAIVLIINIYSLIVWTYRFLPSKRLRYIKRRIDIMRQALFWRNKNPLNFEQMPESLQMHEFEIEIIQHFVHEYLESDGLFILRVLSSNTSDFVCTELIQELWKYYRKQRKFNRSSEDDEDVYDDDESLENSLSEEEPPSKLKNERVLKHNKSKLKMIKSSMPDSSDSYDQSGNEQEDQDQNYNEDNDDENENEEPKIRKNSNKSLNSTSLQSKQHRNINIKFDNSNNNKSNNSDGNSSSNLRAPISKKASSLKSKTLTNPFIAFSGQIASIYKKKPGYSHATLAMQQTNRFTRTNSLNPEILPSSKPLMNSKKDNDKTSIPQDNYVDEELSRNSSEHKLKSKNSFRNSSSRQASFNESSPKKTETNENISFSNSETASSILSSKDNELIESPVEVSHKKHERSRSRFMETVT